jgi:type VI secretion system protein ImpK
MNITGQAPLPPARLNNLALAFQEAITVILRTRFHVQRVENTDSFRAVMRKVISSAAKECGNMGYSPDTTKMAVYAIIGFLDESILSSRDPIFNDWHKTTLQQEMFGSQVAGEFFFRNVADLLNRSGSPEVADVLELHALCLLLGYRGKYDQGDATEVHVILRRIRDKLASIRGESPLFRVPEAPRAPSIKRSDPWVRRLAVTAIGAAIVTAVFYFAYMLLLGHAIPFAAQSMLSHAPSASAGEVAAGMEIAA